MRIRSLAWNGMACIALASIGMAQGPGVRYSASFMLPNDLDVSALQGSIWEGVSSGDSVTLTLTADPNNIDVVGGQTYRYNSLETTIQVGPIGFTLPTLPTFTYGYADVSNNILPTGGANTRLDRFSCILSQNNIANASYLYVESAPASMPPTVLTGNNLPLSVSGFSNPPQVGFTFRDPSAGVLLLVSNPDLVLLGISIEAFHLSQQETCSGDGGDQVGCTDCPCGNNAPAGTVGGCLNSAGTPTRLLPSGSASVSAADLRFEASGAPPQNSAVLTSGNALAPANMASPCFGLNSGVTSISLDGLRCVVQGVLRHGVRPSDLNGDVGVTTNGWGTPNGFFNFSAFTAGSTRHFQIIYRDDASVVCMTGQNTSQAVSIAFAP